jgi:hypothetical protein
MISLVGPGDSVRDLWLMTERKIESFKEESMFNNLIILLPIPKAVQLLVRRNGNNQTTWVLFDSISKLTLILKTQYIYVPLGLLVKWKVSWVSDKWSLSYDYLPRT